MNIKELKEFGTVAVVMFGIMLPIRIIFVQFVSSWWLGSFGLISLISLTILILAKKQKLGKFGEVFQRQMFKSTRGKRKWLFIPTMAFVLFMTVNITLAIELGNHQYSELKEEIKKLIPEEDQNLDSVLQQTKKVEPQDFAMGIILIFYLIFFRFDIYSVTMSYLNDISNGYIQHFTVVFLVEQLEVIGLMLFYRFKIKKQQIS